MDLIQNRPDSPWFTDTRMFDSYPIDHVALYYFILLRHLIGSSNKRALRRIQDHYSTVGVNNIYDFHRIMVLSKVENVDMINETQYPYILQKLRKKIIPSREKDACMTSLKKFFLFMGVVHYYDSINNHFDRNVIEHILLLRADEGVYCNSKYGAPTIGATFDALLMLNWLNEIDEMEEETVNWITNCQSTGFRKSPRINKESLSSTFDALILGLRFNFIEKIRLADIKLYVQTYFDKNKFSFKSLYYLFMINTLLRDKSTNIFDEIYWSDSRA